MTLLLVLRLLSVRERRRASLRASRFAFFFSASIFRTTLGTITKPAAGRNVAAAAMPTIGAATVTETAITPNATTAPMAVAARGSRGAGGCGCCADSGSSRILPAEEGAEGGAEGNLLLEANGDVCDRGRYDAYTATDMVSWLRGEGEEVAGAA